MPVTINEMETQVEVETQADGSGGGSADASADMHPVEALRQWQALAGRALQREARTAAWGFDD